ncbi:NAD-binding oxidoreductase [Hydrogenophaga crassostreae]|uniref:NAD-binding oxidoreductase n=1 Tax=Hydrogenophaga crassostreae TaxID=1763535 RepID=A0A167IIP6_9BURK|nr:4Fe-4S double cluster binding domain-containing protein [Hydrogenophaga crassostreae]AOW14183.1 NAD-binding oxidoreductase [Hydrogenophaga crassostreae]OAD42887.1 NAD-binding oxidoreductase [Hydrogenophaga crassostreae]
MRLFSYRDRPVHLGPYPLERLTRSATAPDLSALPVMQALHYEHADPESLVHAMSRYAAMFDLVRDGPRNAEPGEVPEGMEERAHHLKAAGYYFDASMVATCALPQEALLATPIRNPKVQALGEELERNQPTSFAAGMDMILADVLESARTVHGPVSHHSHALLILVEYPRDPRPDEPGTDWIGDTQAHRAALLSSQTAVLLSTYLRLLGFEARAHSASCSDVDLPRLAVAAGLTLPDGTNPYLGKRYGLAAVTTDFAMAPDQALAPQQDRKRSHGPAWWLGKGTLKNSGNHVAYAQREFKDGAYPFETTKRQPQPTTFIDHDRVPRFPKRADFFARALFGDLGKSVQDNAKNAYYVMKSPIGACARRALGALLLLQFGEARGPISKNTADPERNANNLKAASYYLGVDAVGLCAVPEWAYYSHDSGGNPLPAYHANAVNLLLDQGHETMDGASGDDWIGVAQSMRAYLRFSLLGGVIGEQVRRLGYSARVHTVLDGDVLQPPLLLLSGLGEVSRIGEVILNPFLGPRLKSGSVTTDLPMTADLPIDFGLQRFCEGCNKCARECPSGAISAGPKLMYNGYEIWKSDAEKCSRYRITNAAGAMCGRCMKTCPWNLEGLLADSLWRQVAMKLPAAAPLLARLDDQLDRGSINPVKTWWWNIELDRATGGYVQAAQTNRRTLQKDLKLKYEDQSLAVYPADKMPPPFPVPFPANREEGIERYRSMLTPEQYKQRLAAGQTEGLAPGPAPLTGEPPVFPVKLVRREEMALGVAKYEFASLDGQPLPAFEAGAHIDVVIAPEYQRQYSLAGDPADASKYVLGVLNEPGAAQGGTGRGGSALMHRAFREGRKVFITKPSNHFPLFEDASHSFLFAGGIGVTPMIAMAHRLHALGKPFDFHYSAASRKTAGFLNDLASFPWADRVAFHIKDEGGRADLASLIPAYRADMHVYTCGAPRYMDGVFAAATAAGWPEDGMHREYFNVPEAEAWVDLPFKLKLKRSGRTFDVPADKKATEVLAAAGFAIDVKCSDGLCGVCATGYDATLSGEVEHRDFVLSKKDRQHKVILCCSRPLKADAELVLDL